MKKYGRNRYGYIPSVKKIEEFYDFRVVYLRAKSAIELFNTLLVTDEICVLHVMGCFSLSTAFAAILERQRGGVSGICEKNPNEYKNYKELFGMFTETDFYKKRGKRSFL